MIPYNSEERARWRKRRRTIRRITVAAECLAIVAILAAGAMFIGTKIKHAAGNSQNAASGAATASNQASIEEINLTDNSSQSQAASETASPETPAESLLSEPLPWLRDTIMTRPFPCFRRMHRQPPFRKSSLPLPSTKPFVSLWSGLPSAR